MKLSRSRLDRYIVSKDSTAELMSKVNGMRVQGSATAISWIPSESVTGAVFRVPFEVGFSHYDQPPPDSGLDVDSLLAADAPASSTSCKPGSRCRTAPSSTAAMAVGDASDPRPCGCQGSA